MADYIVMQKSDGVGGVAVQRDENHCAASYVSEMDGVQNAQEYQQ